MGGLKEHQFCESDEFFREYPGPLSNETHPYYLKSEADKYIKELKEQNHELCQALHSMYSEEEMNYQKYKRCLAKARWCASRSASWCFDPADEQLHKSEFYDKWKHRWLELAEKFKEAK